jgi:uncharacterized membrane protein
MNWRLRLRTSWHDLQSSLWFRPAATTILAVILAALITSIDQGSYFAVPTFLRIGIDSARAVLAAIAGAMLAVVGMIFSILMVVLVLASQQFSPRILRNFIRDRTSQDVLSIFIGTFVYTLLVLARTSEYEDYIFTPVLSVTGAIVLAIVAMGAFINFIDHISKTIRASYIVADINRQTEALLKRLYTRGAHHGVANGVTNGEETEADEEDPLQAAEATEYRSPRAGNIQAIDTAALVRIATEYSMVIKVEHLVGDFVARDGLLLSLFPAQRVSQELLDDLYSVFDIGTERTMFIDVLFGIRQLVDIALKAISPAINDPTTAVNCIDYLSNILIQVARHADNPERYYDEEGRLRLIAPQPNFVMMLNLAFDQIRHYSRSEVTITLRTLDALAEIAQATHNLERHAAIWNHASMISRSVECTIKEPYELQKINDRLHEVAARCGGKYEDVELTYDKVPDVSI